MNKGWSSWSLVFAIGLTILWIAGLSTPYSASWLTWLDGFAALVGYSVAVGPSNVTSRAAQSGTAVALSLGLFALWILGLATNGTRWQSWWTFAFGCGYLLVGLRGSRRGPAVPQPIERTPSDRFKRSA